MGVRFVLRLRTPSDVTEKDYEDWRRCVQAVVDRISTNPDGYEFNLNLTDPKVVVLEHLGQVIELPWIPNEENIFYFKMCSSFGYDEKCSDLYREAFRITDLLENNTRFIDDYKDDDNDWYDIYGVFSHHGYKHNDKLLKSEFSDEEELEEEYKRWMLKKERTQHLARQRHNRWRRQRRRGERRFVRPIRRDFF